MPGCSRTSGTVPDASTASTPTAWPRCGRTWTGSGIWRWSSSSDEWNSDERRRDERAGEHPGRGVDRRGERSRRHSTSSPGTSGAGGPPTTTSSRPSWRRWCSSLGWVDRSSTGESTGASAVGRGCSPTTRRPACCSRGTSARTGRWRPIGHGRARWRSGSRHWVRTARGSTWCTGTSNVTATGWEQMYGAVASPNGWPIGLERFARRVAQRHPPTPRAESDDGGRVVADGRMQVRRPAAPRRSPPNACSVGESTRAVATAPGGSRGTLRCFPCSPKVSPCLPLPLPSPCSACPRTSCPRSMPTASRRRSRSSR